MVLRNRAVEAHGLQIIGIDDHDSADQVARVLPCIDVKPDSYSILLYHRPQGLDGRSSRSIWRSIGCSSTAEGSINSAALDFT